MSDVERREIERRWHETGSPAVEVELLSAQLREGSRSRESLLQAARLGHLGAQRLTGEEAGVRSDVPWRVEARRRLAQHVLHGVEAEATWFQPLDLTGVHPGSPEKVASGARGLYQRLLGMSGPAFPEVLGPWVLAQQGRELVPSRLRSLRTSRACSEAELWGLYALSRVNDMLLLAFQQDTAHSWAGASVSMDEYVGVFGALGITAELRAPFHPCHHEVVEVEQADDPDEPIRLVDVLWPGLRFGELQFSRSGVRVRGGRDAIVQEVAEASPLYFTFRRLRRPARDLSQGWGRNSQWRTEFRRDYETADAYHYHVDGRWRVGEEPPGEGDDHLDVEDRVALTRHRCSLLATEDDEDRWPYDSRWVEQKVPAEG